jgi:hypothetical protein
MILKGGVPVVFAGVCNFNDRDIQLLLNVDVKFFMLFFKMTKVWHDAY